MRYIFALPLLAVSALAMPTDDSHKKAAEAEEETVCESHQTVVCSDNGNGGLLSLGNLLNGLLGESCSGGDVYCCSQKDVDQVCDYLDLIISKKLGLTRMTEQVGLINIDLNLQCSLNHLL
jgi:hypothetical protein